MKDVVLDIVKHTAGLGFIENIKVTGTNDATKLEAMDPDRTVILNAQLHAPAAEPIKVPKILPLILCFEFFKLIILNKFIEITKADKPERTVIKINPNSLPEGICVTK